MYRCKYAAHRAKRVCVHILPCRQRRGVHRRVSFCVLLFSIPLHDRIPAEIATGSDWRTYGSQLLLFFCPNRVLTLIEHTLKDHNACKFQFKSLGVWLLGLKGIVTDARMAVWLTGEKTQSHSPHFLIMTWTKKFCAIFHSQQGGNMESLVRGYIQIIKYTRGHGKLRLSW